MITQEVTKRLLVKRKGDRDANLRCSVIAALKVFATKWKPCILLYLASKPMRYNDLFRIIPNISRKMLSLHLKELEIDGLIIRDQHDEKLQRVEYRLSEKGKSLLPIMYQLEEWGLKNVPDVLAIDDMIVRMMN
jgi:DNA-binding HxlR family transcriptional regulator